MSQLYLTGALGSHASASVVQQIDGQTTGHGNSNTFFENLSLGISPSAEYMLATTLYGTSAFDGYGTPYQPALLVYQSSSDSGYGIVEEIHLKGYYDLNTGNIRYDAGKNLTAAQFISNTEILTAGGQLDLDNTGTGGTEATQGYFMQITGSGDSWGIHNYLTGNASHSTTAQARGVNGSQANVIGQFGNQMMGTQIKTNNRFGSAAPSRAASFSGFADGNDHPRDVVTCFQSSSEDGWTFHSQFAASDLTTPSGGNFQGEQAKSFYVKDLAWISETEMVIIYHNYATSNAESHRVVLEYISDEWRVNTTGVTISDTDHYHHQLGPTVYGSTKIENEILHGRNGHRFVEYDDVNEKVWIWYTLQSSDYTGGSTRVEQYDSGSNWLQKFYPTGDNDTSHTPDSTQEFNYSNGPNGDGHTREYAWASLKNSQMWVDSDGNMSALSLYGPSNDSYTRDHLSSFVYAESGSSGFNFSLHEDAPLSIRLDQVLNADTLLSGAHTSNLSVTGALPVAQQSPGGLSSDGQGHQFAWNSLYGGDGNTLIYKEGEQTQDGNAPGRLAVIDLNTFPASNPSLDSSVSQTVGSSGGTVSAGGTEAAPIGKVEIPASALGGNVSITVNTSDTSTAAALKLSSLGQDCSNVVRLLPHGTTFSSPVTVTIRLKDGAPTDNLQLLKRNSETGQWYNTGISLTVSSGTVSFTTTSFSDYIIIGGQKVARTKLNNVQLARLENQDKVLASAMNLTASANTVGLIMNDTDRFLMHSASGEVVVLSASAMATYFAEELETSTIQTTDTDADSSFRITFTSATGTSTSSQIFTDGDLVYNALDNALSLGVLSASSDISGSAALLVGSSATINNGLSVTTGGATITAGGLTVTAGTSDLKGSLIVTGAVNMSAALTAEGAVSGAAGTFDALAGTSLALQGGGITAAGAIAGATTIAGSGLASLGSLAVDDGSTIGTDSDPDMLTLTNEDKIEVASDVSLVVAAGKLELGDGNAVTATHTELNMLDGSSLGTAVASKALVLDSSKNIGTINQLTASAIRVTDLDVVTINSIAQTETTLEIADKLIVASVSGSASDSDGGGLRIGGGQNSTGHASVLWSNGDSALDFNIGASTIAKVDSAGMDVTGDLDVSADLTALSITMAEFSVDSSGNTDIDGTLNVEGVPTFQAGAVFSGGVTTANAIAGATTVSGSGKFSAGGGIDAGLGAQFTVSNAGAVVAASLNNSNGGITNAGSIAGATNIDGSGDLTMATITMTGFSVDADGDTSVKTLDVNSGGISDAGAIAGATTVSGSGKFSAGGGIDAGLGAEFTVSNAGVVAAKSLVVDDGSTIGTDSDTDMLTLTNEDKIEVASNVSFVVAAGKFELGDGNAVTSTHTELNIMDGDTSAASVTLANNDGVVVNDNGTMKQALVSDFSTYLASDGLQVASNKIAISYVCDIFSSASHTGAGLSLDMFTASLSALPLSSSLQVYLNGMLQVASGAVDISGSTDGAYTPVSAWDYKFSSSAGLFGLHGATEIDTATAVVFAEPIDEDDVVQIKYIKK